MTLGEAIKQAVTTDNATLAGQCAETMRFNLGLNYDDSAKLVEKVAGIGVAEWDELLYRADMEDSR